jgi:hypothetical protein
MGSAIRYTTAALIEMMKGSTARARITITDGDDNVITYDEVLPALLARLRFQQWWLTSLARSLAFWWR